MADVTADINQNRVVRIAQRRIEGFAQQFGEAHRNLARHAAFPLVLTPDLVYQIWANFVPEAPWTAVAHVLLSRLCRQVGYEMYEMDISDRNLLLRELKEQFGQERFDELGEFLLDYVAQRLIDDDADTQDLREAQEWTALAYTKPGEAAWELALALSERVQQEDIGEVLRLASLVETLAEPLVKAGFDLLLVYSREMESFARENREIAATEFEKLSGWEQQTIVTGVPLLISINRSRKRMQVPFFPGQPVPPECFVGRASEIASAFDQIYNRSHLAIWGGSGMGKTSFLQKLESPQAWQDHGMDSSQAVIVRFSCESLTPFTPANFWREILSLVKDKLADQSALQAEINTILQAGKPTKDSLRQILRKLKVQDKYLVLLIDDFHLALDTNQEYDEDVMQKFLTECRNLAVHSAEGQHMSMIVTSLKRLNELGPKLNPNASPWYNHYLFLRLKTFNNTEIDDIFKTLRIPYLREAIKENTGGHPSLLQTSGFLLYRDLLTANAPSVDKFVSDFESVTQQIFQNIWQRCSEVEQTLLMLMALSALKGRLHKQKQFDVSGIELIFSQREGELIKLEEQGVVTHTVQAKQPLIFLTPQLVSQPFSNL